MLRCFVATEMWIAHISLQPHSSPAYHTNQAKTEHKTSPGGGEGQDILLMLGQAGLGKGSLLGEGLPVLFTIGEVPLVSQSHHTFIPRSADDLLLRLAVQNGTALLYQLLLDQALDLRHLKRSHSDSYSYTVTGNYI